MDTGETKPKAQAYDDYDDPYAYPSVVPKNYNPDKELSDIAQKPSEMEKDEAFEEVKLRQPIEKVNPQPPKPAEHSHSIPHSAVAPPVTSSQPAKLSSPPKDDNPLHSSPQTAAKPQVNPSASGSAAANLMSKGQAPAEPPKTMDEAKKGESEHSHKVKEEGSSTCKCTIQ
mmetsp:Transcript_22591/g.40663  ORF Transcript_22591/g.40663 Transcript_22591/m.40663 type:complete len:171 (+) Transcript_22591:3462-3974(+)